jgi:hypothetical protein
MRKWIALLFVLGFILYLKPEFKFPDGSNTMRVKQVNGGLISSVGLQGKIALVVSESGKRIYIPVANILFIVEE